MHKGNTMNIDLINTPEEIAHCPLTRYFLETKKNNALEWVSFLDDDTLLMAKSQMDLMESEKTESETDLINIGDKYDDIVHLVVYMLSEEKSTNTKDIVNDETINLTEAAQTLGIYLNCESMRRKGLIAFEKGNGQLLDSTSKFKLTTKGEQFAKKFIRDNSRKE